MLQSAASVIPVPLIKEAIGVGLKIIELCEVCKFLLRKGARWFTLYFCQNISVVGQKVKELQDRVCHLMVVIVDTVTSKNETGCDDTEEVIVKAAKSIERDDDPCTATTYFSKNSHALSVENFRKEGLRSSSSQRRYTSSLGT